MALDGADGADRGQHPVADVRAGGGGAPGHRQGIRTVRTSSCAARAASTRRCSTASIRNRFGVAVDRGAAGRGLRHRRHPHGRRIHPQSRRGRRLSLRSAPHPGHQPDAVGGDGGDAREAARARFPEVKEVFARTGTAEVATDPMPPSTSDGYIMLKPRKEWPDPAQAEGRRWSRRSEQAAEDVPGNAYEFSQPIQQRMNELISGVRSDVARQDLRRRPRRCCVRSAARVAGRAAERAGRRRRQGRAGRRTAGADGQARTARRCRATGSTSPTCRTWWRLRSAARAPAGCSRATAASISSCGCRSICARTSKRSGRCRSRCRRSRAQAKAIAGAMGQFAAGPDPLRAAVGGRPDRRRAGPQPDQPRGRQAARSSSQRT